MLLSTFWVRTATTNAPLSSKRMINSTNKILLVFLNTIPSKVNLNGSTARELSRARAGLSNSLEFDHQVYVEKDLIPAKVRVPDTAVSCAGTAV
jgi:hypothetical protein